MSATIENAMIETTATVANGSTVVSLVSESGPGWSVSSTGLTLTPQSNADLPALYLFSITPPSDYGFTGGAGLSFSEDQTSAYAIAVGARCAFMVAMDNVTGTVTPTNSLTLTVTATSGTGDPIPVDPSVAFNPPG